jgi:hypothetical protein
LIRLLSYALLCLAVAAVWIWLPLIVDWSNGSFVRPIVWSGSSWPSRPIYMHRPAEYFWFDIWIAWPPMTFISLLIFRASMRQAKIRNVHVLRCVIYSCDFGFLFGILYCAMYLSEPQFSEGWLILLAAAVCATITTYRLSIAFRLYLRVHLPLATVVASQLIAFLLTFLVLIQIVDFSRRI